MFGTIYATAMVLKLCFAHSTVLCATRNHRTLNLQVNNSTGESETRARKILRIIILQILYLTHTT